MQIHFLKNMASVSIAAILFSTVGMKILADQVPANIPEETTSRITISQEGESLKMDILNKAEEPEANPLDNTFEPTQSNPNVMLSEDERAIVRNLLKEEAESERLSQDMEVDPFQSAILDTPEKRSAARVSALGEFGDDATEWRHEHPFEDSSNHKSEQSAYSKGDEMAPLSPESNNPPQVDIEANAVIEETLPADIAPVSQAAVVAPVASISEYNERPALLPQEEEAPVAPQEEVPVVYKQNNLSDRIVSLSPSETRPTVIRPNFKVATPIIYGGDDEDVPPTKEEDPDDPTSRGTRKGGQHKGTELVKPRVIPIIRMGQDQKESGGLTVIKPWNS